MEITTHARNCVFFFRSKIYLFSSFRCFCLSDTLRWLCSVGNIKTFSILFVIIAIVNVEPRNYIWVQAMQRKKTGKWRKKRKKTTKNNNNADKGERDMFFFHFWLGEKCGKQKNILILHNKNLKANEVLCWLAVCIWCCWQQKKKKPIIINKNQAKYMSQVKCEQ